MRLCALFVLAFVVACTPPRRLDDSGCNGKPATTFFRDADGDGFGDPAKSQSACAAPAGYVAKGGDCDDTNAAVHPGASEVACNGIDDDCDPATVDDPDADHDGFGACDGDCDDADPNVHPGATEACNGKDDDCNGVVDDGLPQQPFFPDADGDGFGNASAPSVSACAAPEGFVADHTDCDDTRASVHPGATEIACNGLDDDCDPSTTDTPDEDHDGVSACAGDCDDHDPSVHPGAVEVCNGHDDNCNGEVDEGLPTFAFHHDADHDGFGGDATVTACGPSGDLVLQGGDCNDSDPSVHPGAAELCDGKDRDCDGRWRPLVPSVCPTIQSALDLAGPGDTISVAPGTYRENVVFRGVDVTLVATGGAEVTTIDGGGASAPAVTIQSGETSATVLDGFTIRHGTGWIDTTQCQDTKCPRYGGGVLVKSASPTLRNLVVTQNDLVMPSGWSYGGGMAFLDSDAKVTRSRIVDDTSDYYGGGVYVGLESHVTLDQTLVAGDQSPNGNGGGLAVYFAELDLTNAIVAGNSAGSAGGIFCQGCTLAATNVTGYENTSRYDGGFLEVDDGGHAALTNTAVVSSPGDGGAGVDVETSSSSAATLAYCDVNSNALSPTSLLDATDVQYFPNFVATNGGNWANWDFHLGAGSRLVDAGDPTVQDVDGTRSDIGAYGGPGGNW